MDEAVLGLVGVTCVCIMGHIITAWYFSKLLKDEAVNIDDKINQIDEGLGAIAQWMVDKFETTGSQGVIDWGQIISQLFSQNNSPNNDYSRALNGQFNGETQQQQETERPETLEGTILDENS